MGATTRGAAMSVEPLAYEIRRLSKMLMTETDGEESGRTNACSFLSPDDDAETPLPSSGLQHQLNHRRGKPGALAHRLAETFGLRGIDVDIALVVLAADIDHEFRSLLFSISARNELSILAAILPRLEERLALLGAVGPDAPTVKCGLLRRTEEAGLGVLTPSRRFRAVVLGQHPLSILPSFARRIDATRPVPWADSPNGLLEAMASASEGSLCIVSGATGVGKTTWARHAARSIATHGLYIDAEVASRTANAHFDADVGELLDDAAFADAAVVIDNADHLVKLRSPLASAIERAVDTTRVRVILIVSDIDNVDSRLAGRAVGHVCISEPSAAARRELWRQTIADVEVCASLASELVMSPRQINNALMLVAAGVEPHTAARQQLSHALPAVPDHCERRNVE